MLNKLIVLVTAILWIACAPVAEELPLNAQTVLAIDADTNEILVNKNAEEARSIASITKLMTAVVTIDADLPLDDVVTISQDEVTATMLHGRPMSNTLPVGTKLTRSDLLLLALMNSQNRAAAALARTYPGGRESFVAAMNAKAESLGMVNTHYVDPTGLYSDNMSTAHDLALLVQHAYQYELIRAYSTETSFVYSIRGKKKARPVMFQTTNVFVRMNKWDIYLQKTGYIQDAGRCMVMMASAGIKRVIIVVLNAASTDDRAGDILTVKNFIETGEVRRVLLDRPVAKKRIHRIKVKRSKR